MSCRRGCGIQHEEFICENQRADLMRLPLAAKEQVLIARFKRPWPDVWLQRFGSCAVHRASHLRRNSALKSRAVFQQIEIRCCSKYLSKYSWIRRWPLVSRAFGAWRELNAQVCGARKWRSRRQQPSKDHPERPIRQAEAHKEQHLAFPTPPGSPAGEGWYRPTRTRKSM